VRHRRITIAECVECGMNEVHSCRGYETESRDSIAVSFVIVVKYDEDQTGGSLKHARGIAG